MSHACPGDAPTPRSKAGFALIQCDWIVRSGDDPCAAPLAWAEGTGCDLVLLDQGAEDGLSYATRWNARARDTSLAEFEAGVERWVSYYRGIGAQVDRLRHAGPSPPDGRPANWQRTFPLATWPAGAAGEHVRRLFEAQDLLAAVDGGELLDLALRPVEGFRLDQRLRYRDGKYHQPPAQVERRAGARASTHACWRPTCSTSSSARRTPAAAGGPARGHRCFHRARARSPAGSWWPATPSRAA